MDVRTWMRTGGGQMKHPEWARTRTNKFLYLAAIALICSVSSFGDTTAFTLTGVSGGTMSGVYTSPYIASFSGQSEYVICDDYTHDSTIGQTFNATYTNVSTLTGTTAVKWDWNNATAQQHDYAVAAYLAEEIIQLQTTQPGNTTQLGYDSFALWNVFDTALLPATYPSGGACNPYGCLDQTQYNGALAAYNDAQAHHLDYTSYSDVWIFTPTPNQSVSQEFLYIGTVPEPSSLYLLGIMLVGLMGMAWRRKRPATAAVRK